MNGSNFTDGETGWKSLFRIGGWAPLIAIAFMLSEVAIVVFGGTYPADFEGWVALFQRSKFLGLHYLNVLDIASTILIGIMFLALFVALRRANKSWTAIAALLAFIGVATFAASRWEMAQATLTLTDGYAAAATDETRSQIRAAALAVTSGSRPTPQTAGFLLIAAAAFIISVVMHTSGIFDKKTAVVGMLAGILTAADDVCLIAAPRIAGILLGVLMVVWVAWWLMTGIGLLALGRREKADR